MAVSLRNLKIRQQIYLVALPPLFILVGASVLAFYGYLVAMRANRSLRDSHESLVQGEIVLRRLAEMYGGVRECLMLRQAEPLPPYQEAATRMSDDLAAWRRA